MAKLATKALIVAALVCLVFDNASAKAAVSRDGGGGGGGGGGDENSDMMSPSAAAPTSLMDRVTGVMNSVKQQADETLDGAGNAASMLSRLQPAVGAKGPDGGARKTENRLVGDDALNRLQETKGRTVNAAKRVIDETVHKLQATVDEIKRTVTGGSSLGEDEDPAGDRRVSNALDNLLRAVGSEGRAAFNFASDVINETADRAKAAVDKAQQQRQQRRLPSH